MVVPLHPGFTVYSSLVMENKNKIFETHLVIITGLIVIYLLKGQVLILYISLAFAFIGIFVKPMATLITKGWFGLAFVLNKISSTVLLSLVYFLILLPISLLFKLRNTKMLNLKNRGNSLWNVRNHDYQKKDMDNLW